MLKTEYWGHLPPVFDGTTRHASSLVIQLSGNFINTRDE